MANVSSYFFCSQFISWPLNFNFSSFSVFVDKGVLLKYSFSMYFTVPHCVLRNRDCWWVPVFYGGCGIEVGFDGRGGAGCISLGSTVSLLF